MNAPLFREEALRHRVERLHGNVSIATPLAWQLIGFLLAAALIATIAFLSLASYARVQVVSGVVALDKGVPAIVPTRAGVIDKVLVREGERVRAGQRLALVRADESDTGGRSAGQQVQAALARQDAELADQTRLQLDAAAADQRRLSAQIDGDTSAIASLQTQIRDQRELITAAQTDFDRASTIAERGFISKRDMDQRRALILTRRQQLAELEQSVSDKRSSVSQARRAIAQAGIAAGAQAASTRSSRALLQQQQVQADLSQGYALKAPEDGIVTGLVARAGQPVTSEQQLMMVVPPGAKVRVDLYIPTTGVGFVKPGQDVRLSIDAFSYQMFGTVAARIASVSRATITRAGAEGPTPVYLASATVDRPWVQAFGRREPLRAGMTLTAHVVTERRSLLRWLFEPLFAVRRA